MILPVALIEIGPEIEVGVIVGPDPESRTAIAVGVIIVCPLTPTTILPLCMVMPL